MVQFTCTGVPKEHEKATAMSDPEFTPNYV